MSLASAVSRAAASHHNAGFIVFQGGSRRCGAPMTQQQRSAARQACRRGDLSRCVCVCVGR
ncbi:hypothetical protein E2C01_091637 [Portunus trituberculatus]|uniref:Uncharacterized protein n=1 Tax=Portunus trituberculatus TaxID=210409 RepID=A0A5B7JNG6_PORTR|nr:hypothetical protein [Portunus trituberculatus]